MPRPERDPERTMAEFTRTSMRAIPYLCQQIPGWAAKPLDAKMQMLREMGFSREQTQAILSRDESSLRRRIPDDIPDNGGGFPGGGEGGGDDDSEPDLCEIGWHPNVLAPVFYGIQDLAKGREPLEQQHAKLREPATGIGQIPIWDGPPLHLRIFYPSLDGAVWSAPLLENCGRYPLVIFCHGHCNEPNHYQRWYHLPAQLARSGFVVAVPELPLTGSGSAPWGNDLELAQLEDTLDWMRQEWEHHDQLLPAPETVVMGHSYGALLAGRLAVRNEVGAYVSFSGVWNQWPTSQAGQAPIFQLQVPSLFTWGTDGIDEIIYATLNDATWADIPNPKHRVVSAGATHWDYIKDPACDQIGEGPCEITGAVAADFATLFASKHAPPEGHGYLNTYIEDDLRRPQFDPSAQQEFFMGGHLMGMAMMENGEPNCMITHTWTDTEGDEHPTIDDDWWDDFWPF